MMFIKLTAAGGSKEKIDININHIISFKQGDSGTAVYVPGQSYLVEETAKMIRFRIKVALEPVNEYMKP